MTHIQVMYRVDDAQEWVYWKTQDGGHHGMPFEINQETVEAVLIAMKLS